MTDSSIVWVDEASRYDQARPTAPVVLVDLLTQLSHTPRPALVVDLGCGTGRSTIIWAERAERVIGIEPSADMRNVAISKLAADSCISYQAGVGHQTGIDSSSADIVTCAQALHWMEPNSTLAEIARILRPGGVFAAYDYHWPPTIHWELDQIFQQVDQRFEQLIERRATPADHPGWDKQHRQRMQASGLFQHTLELTLHHCEYGAAQRFIDLILSSGYHYHLKNGTLTEQELGFDQLKQAAHDLIGPQPIAWYFIYQVCIGIR
ncbi:class I SAM-dependent methyltransferase [Herpetosiphon giganteus]|uniref:class I SAM-dependent methyltransferase n=1 Tax=Herpetosiphon giganteus TaxID=2029754 RepID=UPI0019583415|nr:class I SAM-dependent methyltransferase [Herpetosiphon giganteus]MBM7843255.1 ubiquinone/menaquinone biosynthesis C-methylase UbiE [Herpetosiphon giganteus]